MKGLLLTHKGMEDIAALEIEELIKQKSELDEGCICFPIKSYEDLFRLCYRSQSAGKVCLLLSSFKYSNLIDDFEKNISTIEWDKFIKKDDTLQVRCKKTIELDDSTPGFEKRLSAIIINDILKKQKYKPAVDLLHPTVCLFIYITEKQCFFGIDFSGFDLSKRSHHIFSHPADPKGTLAYGLVRLSGFKNKLFMDCFSGAGMIPIEAALFACHFPVNFYNKEKFAFRKMHLFSDFDFSSFFVKEDKKIDESKSDIFCIDASMKNISFAKKNAQIAGILKSIEFSRMELEWLETRYTEGTIHHMASKLPLAKEKGNEKHYKELVYQAEFILNKKGTLAVIGVKEFIEKYAKEYKLNIVSHRIIFSGKEQYDVLTLTK